MRLTRLNVAVTTDEDGDAVAYTPACNGVVRCVSYVKPSSGGFADGVDFDIIADKSGAVIWDEDDVNASATVFPMMPAHDNKGALVAGSYAPIPIVDEQIKITVADGGDGGKGAFIFVIEGVAM